MHSALVTDNPRQGAFIQKGLQYENLSCEMFSSDQVAQLQEKLPFCDGILLLFQDIPRLYEYARFCRSLRQSAPLMVLSHADSQEFRSLLDELQIELFAFRPFSFRTIASELRNAIFQVREGAGQDRLVVRDLELDVTGHQVWCESKRIHLRNKEFALLQYFMLHRGKVLSRTALLENVWDHNANILTNTVDVHISQLRKKIRQCSSEEYIFTVPCRGYFLA